jgi:DNA-binding NarL/FixJ family response regulator
MSGDLRQRVLVVDDADLVRGLIAEGLRERFPDITVVEAESFEQGYHRARECHPRLAILDVSMPDGNGFELTRRIREELPETEVCICTLHDAPEFRQGAAESGAAWFIAKQGDFWNDAERVVRAAFEGVRDDRRGSLTEGLVVYATEPAEGAVGQKRTTSH